MAQIAVTDLQFNPDETPVESLSHMLTRTDEPGTSRPATMNSVSVTLRMSKNTVGAPNPDGEFSFGIFNEGTELYSAVNDPSGLVTFAPIEFTEPGTFAYTIKETAAPDGWDTDTTPYPVEIEVTREENALLAKVNYPDGVPRFVNTRQTEECDTFVFNEITFDAPGTYEFTVTEENLPSGWSTEDGPFTLTVEVIDDGHGNLIATLTPGTFPTFTNTYAAQPAKIIISGTKIAFGADLDCGAFTFGLYDENGLIETVTNGFTPIA